MKPTTMHTRPSSRIMQRCYIAFVPHSHWSGMTFFHPKHLPQTHKPSGPSHKPIDEPEDSEQSFEQTIMSCSHKPPIAVYCHAVLCIRRPNGLGLCRGTEAHLGLTTRSTQPTHHPQTPLPTTKGKQTRGHLIHAPIRRRVKTKKIDHSPILNIGACLFALPL
jgi:hypothetical protein